MVPAADCHHSRFPRDIKFSENFVKGTANLEGARGLKDLQFQVDVRAQHLAQRAAANGGRSFDIGANALARLLDILEGDHLAWQLWHRRVRRSGRPSVRVGWQIPIKKIQGPKGRYLLAQPVRVGWR